MRVKQIWWTIEVKALRVKLMGLMNGGYDCSGRIYPHDLYYEGMLVIMKSPHFPIMILWYGFVDERGILWDYACSDGVTWIMLISMSNS